MKKWLIPVFALGLLGATPQSPTPGIAQLAVTVHVGYEVKLRVYSVPPIAFSMSVRDAKIASVDARGVVHGVAPGVTWVRAKYYDGSCIKTDSAKVTVKKRAR
jgi:hypothetical protein